MKCGRYSTLWVVPNQYTCKDRLRDWEATSLAHAYSMMAATSSAHNSSHSKTTECSCHLLGISLAVVGNAAKGWRIIQTRPKLKDRHLSKHVFLFAIAEAQNPPFSQDVFFFDKAEIRHVFPTVKRLATLRIKTPDFPRVLARYRSD